MYIGFRWGPRPDACDLSLIQSLKAYKSLQSEEGVGQAFLDVGARAGRRDSASRVVAGRLLASTLTKRIWACQTQGVMRRQLKLKTLVWTRVIIVRAPVEAGRIGDGMARRGRWMLCGWGRREGGASGLCASPTYSVNEQTPRVAG